MIAFVAIDDAGTGRVDVAGNLVADHDRRRRRVLIEPEARQNVREVDAGRAYCDANFAVPRRRIGTVSRLEHLRAVRLPSLDIHTIGAGMSDASVAAARHAGSGKASIFLTLRAFVACPLGQVFPL